MQRFYFSSFTVILLIHYQMEMVYVFFGIFHATWSKICFVDIDG